MNLTVRQTITTVSLVLVTALAFVLRTFRLDVQSLRGDEILSLLAIRGDFQSMLSSNALLDHPPLYFVLLRVWIFFVGDSDFAVRFPSVILGVLTVVVVYQLGIKLFNRWTGFFAALLASLSPFLISYSQEARSYGMAIFFATVSVYYLVMILDRGNRRWWVGWAVTTLLAVMSDYTAVQVVAFAEGFLLLSMLGRRRPAVQWIFSNAFIAVPFVPWVFLNRAVSNIYTWDSAAWGNDFGQMLRWTFVTFTAGLTLEGLVSDAFTVIFMAIGLLGILFGGFRLRNSALVLAYLIIPIIVTWAVSLGVLGFAPRHLLVAMPGFFLLIAGGFGYLASRSRIAVALSGVIILVPSAFSLNNYYFNPLYFREDFRAVAQYLDNEMRGSEAVIFSSPWSEELFLYYRKGNWKSVGIPQTPDDSESKIASSLQELTRQNQKIRLVVFHPESTKGASQVEKWLETNTYPLGPKGYNQTVVRSYLTRSPISKTMPEISHRQAVDLEGKVKFLGYDLDPSEVGTRSRLYITLYWQAQQQFNKDYRVYTQLIGPQRLKWGEKDNRPIHDTLQTSRWIKGMFIRDEYAIDILPGTPPGEYGLVAGIYDPSTGSSLGVTGMGRDFLLLGSVTLGKGKAPESLDVLQLHSFAGTSFGEITLLGARLQDARSSIQEVRAGDSVPITLFWQARKAPSSNHLFTLSLVDADERVLSKLASSPVGGHYPSSDWSVNEIVRDKRRLSIPADIPEGIHRIKVNVDESEVEVVQIKVIQRERTFDIPVIQNATYFNLDNNISLLGYDIAVPESTREDEVFQVRPGVTISLTLYWKATGKSTGNFAVFNHFADAKGGIWGQKDMVPKNGYAPTTSWMEGEIISDTFLIPVRSDTPKGNYQLITGMYRQDTGQRSLSDSGQDHLTLGQFEIR